MNGLGRVAPLHQRLPDGDGRHDMPSRAATGNDGPDATRRVSHQRAPQRGQLLAPDPPGHDCLAILASMPAPNMAMTSDDPPNDTNGNGTPVTGRRPTTGPMLMTA